VSDYEHRDPWDEEQTPGQMSFWNTIEPAVEPIAEPPKKKRRGGLIALALCGTLVLGSVGGAAGGYLIGRERKTTPAASSTAVSADPADTQAETALQEPTETPNEEMPAKDQKPLVVTTNNSGVMMTPAEVYANNVNAVVSVANEVTTNIFGQVSSTASSGSGFIVDAEGYIVTNYHVVEGAQTLKVTLTSGETYPATLVGGDADNDVALLKIEGDGFPTCQVGDSDVLRVGEMVAAIGNPLGELTNTLTVGYISALDREINTDGTPINMLQTDAAINAGNSGGPLFDMYGNVVGITTAKYASSSIEGLGFAIPINDAMRIVADLKMYGYVIGRPYLGIYSDDLTVTMASYYNLPVGVYVSGVIEDGAADRAGIEQGDIICEMNGERCQTQTELSAIMKNYSAGDTVTVQIYRGGKYKELSLTFDEKPKTETTTTPSTQTQPSAGSSSGFPFFSFGFGG